VNELRSTVDILQHGIASGDHPGAQIYVSLRGKVIADTAVGHARENVPLTRDSLMPWLSAGKPITAVCVAKVWERGALDLDDRVTKFVPEFAAHGKEAVTIRHVLTHTGCFPNVNTGWPHVTWDEVIRRICNAPLHTGWKVGEVASYHIHSGWFILAEIIRRIDGRTFDAFVREELFEPLGMRDSWIGMPLEKFEAYGERIAIMHQTERSPAAPPKPDPLFRAERFAFPAPGSNAVGPIRELGIFYEMMLAKGRRGPLEVLSPQAVDALTAPHRVGMVDQVFQHKMDWGLGFIIDSKHYGQPTLPYGFGPHASRRTFGHSGNQSSCAFADPEHGLVVAWACNGQSGEDRHHARAERINAAIYEDLKLAY